MKSPNLHDAVLTETLVNWMDEAAELHFRSEAPITLFVRGLYLLHAPHECPWGPSSSVNVAKVVAASRTDRQRMEIEMQSGDTIVIEAREFVWSP